MEKGPGHRALRKGRVSVPGNAYLVTAVCDRRQTHFARFHVACAASRALCEAALGADVQLLSWVLMPDHWHGLLRLGNIPLSTAVQRLHSSMARAANAAGETKGKIWQGAWHDHALRPEEDVHAIARYVVENPLRAGLVLRMGDYPFWNAAWI